MSESRYKVLVCCLTGIVLFIMGYYFSAANDNRETGNPFAEAVLEELASSVGPVSPAESVSPAEPASPVETMVYYEGKPLSIFFHSLIARPEIAFKGNKKEHFKEWFVTAEEYKKILDELYIRDYVLVDINEFYTVTITNNVKTVKMNKFLIPEGKKPVILSVDDLSYYDHYRKNGIVHKLVLDRNGDIAAWTNTPSGGEISYDQDIITVTEDFIKKHPDFSIRGAKGIIALTGFEGVLGYRTQSERSKTAGYQEEIEGAVAVANKLKELGWHFASHSYGHINMPKVSMAAFTRDNRLWDAEVRPILGETDLFVYPYGANLGKNEDKHKILREMGFNLFFGVGGGYTCRPGPKSDYIYLSRMNIDGTYFRKYRNKDDKLFDIDKVMDKQNRNIR